MENGIAKFRELLLTDEGFQQKLKTAAEAYNGEQTEEAVFDNILVPLASEYGITATFEEYKKYMTNMEDKELSSDEVAQIAGGGKGSGGYGANLCLGFGIGAGMTSDTVCFAFGYGKPGACVSKGVWVGGGE